MFRLLKIRIKLYFKPYLSRIYNKIEIFFVGIELGVFQNPYLKNFKVNWTN